MKVLSPVGALEQKDRRPSVRRFATLDDTTIGLIELRDSSAVFNDRIVARLRADFPRADIIRFVKPVDMAPSPAAVLEDLEARADLVISTYGH